MWRVLVVVFLIFGTIVGSGFSSGKEIFVFFSRFGVLSHLYIALAGVMFFFLLRFFLLHGQKCSALVQKSAFARVLVIFISAVFCSSMFAGVKNLFSHFSVGASVLATSAVLVCCLWLTVRGIGGLERFNFAVMPLTALLFFVVLLSAAAQKPALQFGLQFGQNFAGVRPALGLFFCPLYVALNCSLGGLVICRAGGGLGRKQANLAAFLAVGLLLVFLFLGNFVLQKNPLLQDADMPFLMLSRGSLPMFCVAFGIIFVGCFTTLVSMCFNLKTALDGVCKNGAVSTIAAVFVPFAASSLGFSQIVQFLYPICSVLGIFVLIFMLFPVAKKRKKSKKM